MIKKLAACIREYKGDTIRTPLFVALEVVLECIIPFVSAKLVNSIEKGCGIETIVKYGLIMLVMAFASLYIGDSQTMAAEAGVLGVPFVRFNDFVGRIGYLKELEDVYELGYGVHASPLTADSTIKRADGTAQPSGVEALYKRVEQLVVMPAEERKATFQTRREKMLSEKIDCAKFLTYFIENYPDSVAQTKNADKEFWKKFK